MTAHSWDCASEVLVAVLSASPPHLSGRGALAARPPPTLPPKAVTRPLTTELMTNRDRERRQAAGEHETIKEVAALELASLLRASFGLEGAHHSSAFAHADLLSSIPCRLLNVRRAAAHLYFFAAEARVLGCLGMRAKRRKGNQWLKRQRRTHRPARSTAVSLWGP